jgi:preprotein translocase subunit YajC
MGQNGMQMLAMVVPIAALGGLSYYLVQRRKRSDRAPREQRNRQA